MGLKEIRVCFLPTCGTRPYYHSTDAARSPEGPANRLEPTFRRRPTMYFRNRFSSFEEFQRESFDFGDREFGKEE
ncbi:MAG: hypothetical protein KC457_32060, partial [Myxococcales bacterium]|nr:hypothetical protein [Myxococcales bacterium]